MKVLILTEAGRNIGFGHLTRCIGLYQGFKEKKIDTEIILKADKSVDFLLKRIKHRRIDWLQNQKRILNQLKNNNVDIVVIDSYLANSDFYKKVSKMVKTPVYIDDYKRLDYPAGIVVNPSIYGDRLNYPKKKDTVYLLGKNYIILRREFWHVPNKKINKEIRNVLIAFGGMNHQDLACKIKDYLKSKFDFNVYAVSPSEKVTARTMLNLMLKADICISGGGQTTYELARVGVPTIAICFVKNQLLNLIYGKKLNYLNFIRHYNVTHLFKKIEKHIINMDYEFRNTISQNGRIAIDGNRVKNLINKIFERYYFLKLKEDFRVGDTVIKNFINLTSREKEIILMWRNDDAVKRWCFSDHIISKQEHKQFIEGLRKNNKKFYWLVKSNNKSLGVISLAQLDFINKNAYLGIYANREFKHIGRLLMRCLKDIAFKIVKLHTLKLEVIEINRRAIKFYKKEGFKQEGQLKEFVYRDGRWLDVVVMGIVNKND